MDEQDEEKYAANKTAQSQTTLLNVRDFSSLQGLCECAVFLCQAFFVLKSGRLSRKGELGR